MRRRSTSNCSSATRRRHTPDTNVHDQRRPPLRMKTRKGLMGTYLANGRIPLYESPTNVKYWNGQARTRLRRAGCQDRGWLAAYLRLNDMSIWGRCCQSRVPLRRIFGWVNRYDRQKLTRKSMPESDWMAGTIGSAEHEFAPLQGDRLGLIACFDRKTGHHPRCRLRRRQNREQVGCNRH